MDLAWLEDFEALAQSGNFSRAAGRRHVTQPAFSRRIRALEHWAGSALFDRARQPVSLTAAGLRLRPHVVDVLRRLREAREEVRAVGDTGLRLAATHALSFVFLPAWLADLGSGGPEGAVHLISDGLEGCEAAMLAGRADFMIGHHHPAAPFRLGAPDFLARTIGHDRLVRVAAPGRADGPCLAYGDGSGLGQIVAAARPGNEGPVAFVSHLAAVLRRLARDGRGVAWLPASLVAGDLDDGSLAEIERGDAIGLEIRLLRPTKPLGRAAERFWSRLGGSA